MSLGLLFAGGLLFFVCVRLVPGDVHLQDMLLLAFLALYAEWRAVRLPVYGYLNPGEGFYLAAACLYGPLAGGLLALFLGLFADLRLRKAGYLVLYNAGWALTTFGLVGAVFPVTGWIGAALLYLLVARGLQALGQRTFFLLSSEQVVRRQLKEASLMAPSSLGFCYLSVVFLGMKSFAVLILLFPLELISTYVRTRELSQELQQTLQELALTQAQLVATGRQASLGVMAAGIAHELNNPLAAASTSLHLVKSVGLPEAVRPGFTLLETAMGRCQDIVGRMIKYSRKPGMGEQTCQVAEVIGDAVVFSGNDFVEQVELKLELGELPRVQSDPAELVQVFSNLLSNARNAGATSVTVRGSHSDGVVSLEVSDNGSGIESELRDQIFEPFFTTREVGAGTGLGLSIAQGLARGHGGELSLASSVPGSTVFELRLVEAS